MENYVFWLWVTNRVDSVVPDRSSVERAKRGGRVLGVEVGSSGCSSAGVVGAGAVNCV